MAARTIEEATAQIAALARAPELIAHDAARSIERLIDAGFDAGRDPYGQPWAPLKPATLAKGRTPPPLTATRAMRDSVSVDVDVRADGVDVRTSADISPTQFHQGGTRNMAQRLVVPSEAKGLPAAWDRAIREAAERVIDEGWGE